MKKILIVAVPVGILAVFLFATVGFSQGRGHHGHRGPHGMMKDFMLFKLDRLSKELNLNPSQQAKWDAFANDLEANMEERFSKRRDVHRQIHEELTKEDPDVNKVKALIHSQIDEHARTAHSMADRVLELYSDLNPEQKKLVSEHIAERWERRGID